MSRTEDQMDKKLEELLRTPPEFNLSEGFQDRVFRKIAQREAVSTRAYSWVYALAIAIFLIAAVICLVLFSNTGSLTGLLEIGSWGAMIGVLVVIFQLLDNRLVRKKSHLI